jgi:adenosylcobinamide-GDP ribazoletransferase
MAPLPARPAAPGWLRDLAGAWIFYSVLPAWGGIEPRFERIARFAPCVGLALGAIQGLLWWALAGRVPPLTQVCLVVVAGLALSGGLHMDGAMDTADGLAAGKRKLEAMNDSRIGAAGAQALAVLLLLRIGALAALAGLAPLPLAWAALWGRVAPLVAMDRFPYLRAGGSAAFHRRHWAGLSRELQPGLIAAAVLLAAGLVLDRPGAAWVGLSGALPAWLVPLRLGRRLGGHTGDSYGACVEWSEILALLLSAALLRAAPLLAALPPPAGSGAA